MEAGRTVCGGHSLGRGAVASKNLVGGNHNVTRLEKLGGYVTSSSIIDVDVDAGVLCYMLFNLR